MQKIKVLVIHNRYQQPGGEDTVFSAESELLRRAGHDVFEFVEDNRGLDETGRARAAIEAIWSRATQEKLRALMREARPDVAHFHNTFPRISPAAYYACRQEGVPVVQSLHNPRLMCPSANFYRNGSTCVSCLGKSFAWPGIVHGCYRSSRSATSLVALMVAFHRGLGTWQRAVDVYVTFTKFYRQYWTGAPRFELA